MEHNFGETLSRQRQNRNLTQEEFAGRIGVTPQAVSKWERGQSLPDVSLLEGICRTLQIGANELLGIGKEASVVENDDEMMESRIRNNLFAEPLMIEIGEGLLPAFKEGLKTDLVNEERLALAKETGMLLPLIRIRDSLDLEENEAAIRSYDRILWRGKAEEEDAFRILVKQAVKECRAHYDTILNKQLVKTITDNVKELYPGAADGLVPEKISYLKLLRVLQEKVRTQGNIRDMLHILEELEETIS